MYSKLVEEGSVFIQPYFYAGLFAKALDGMNVKELITNVGSSAGSAAPAAAGPADAAAPGEQCSLFYFNVTN